MLDTIRDMLNREPFQPFRIILTSGSTYDVLYPNLVALGETQILFAFPKSDKFAVLRLNQVAAVETLPAAA